MTLLDRAVNLYARCEISLQQPSRSDSGTTLLDGRTYVVLRNINGVLAVYRVRRDGALRRLRRWPSAVEAH
jgi:hypothetical protein